MQKAIEAIKNAMFSKMRCIDYSKDAIITYEREKLQIDIHIAACKKEIEDCQASIDELNRVLASLTGADVRVEK